MDMAGCEDRIVGALLEQWEIGSSLSVAPLEKVGNNIAK